MRTLGIASSSGGSGSAPAVTITGTMQTGSVLTASIGSGFGGTPTYQWVRGADGASDLTGASNISGATASTYTLVSADEGRVVGCLVSGLTFQGRAAGVVAGVAPSVSAAPSITGTPTVGTATSFTTGTYGGSTPISKAVQWLLDGAEIVGQTGSTYTPISADAGKTLAVRETASNAFGSAVSTSAGVVVSAAAALQPLRIVSAGGGVAQALTTVTLYNSSYYRGIAGKDIVHIGSGGVTGFHVQFNNATLSGFNTNSITFQELWVTADSNAGVQVKWAGSNTRTFTAGEVDGLGDWISAQDLGFASGVIPQGTTIRIGSRAEVAGNTDKLPLHNDNNTSNTSALFYVPGSGTVGGLSGTGGLSFSGSVISATAGLTFNLVGRFASGDPIVFAGVGDSITWGANDSLAGSTNYTPGWFKRSLYDDWANKTGVRAGVQIARYGSTAAVWAVTATENRAVIAAVLKYCNFMLDRYGTNNIQASGNQAAADAIIAERKVMWDWFKTTVGPTTGRQLEVAALGLFSKVTGTYTTLAGQTPKAGCTLGDTMDLLDTKLATIAGTPTGPDYFVPLTTSVRGASDKSNPDYWKWAVTPGPTTDDGTHPIILGHELEAANMRTFYATL